VHDPDRQPVPDSDTPRPWEEPGAVRRDVQPHRGDLLLLLARVALVLSACCFCFAPFILVALPFTAVAFTLAHRDRKRMEAGAMDPAGRAQADRARVLCWLAFALQTTGAVCCMWLAIVVQRHEAPGVPLGHGAVCCMWLANEVLGWAVFDL
jgi:hypothetical protein